MFFEEAVHFRKGFFENKTKNLLQQHFLNINKFIKHLFGL